MWFWVCSKLIGEVLLEHRNVPKHRLIRDFEPVAPALGNSSNRAKDRATDIATHRNIKVHVLFKASLAP
jgi:hypothetical protein